jgi:hypothetical protein
MSGPEFVYIDESGDTGSLAAGGSKTYTLGCVMVPMAHWTDALDHLVSMRRRIKSDYGLKMAEEVKANHLVGVKKIYRDLNLGDGQVRDIYQRHMDAIEHVSSGVGAIVVNKPLIKRADLDVFDTAWEYLLTRLRKRTEATGHPIVVIHDDGEPDRVRKHLRRFRRRNWQGSSAGEARMLIEDPVARDSRQSYLIQLADLTAYAASRHAVPTTGRTTRICSEEMWTRVSARHIAQISTRNDGIYMWPTK